MADDTDGGVKTPPKRDRSVADVAREAFENRLVEGDGAIMKRRPAPQ